MSAELVAHFQKRFRGGAVIRADFTRPSDAFSITVLFGPSGCGKTTTLRCLGGLERPEEGFIQFGAATWFDESRGVFLSPRQRDIGFLFQEYALFPHLTVAQNIAYGLAGLPRAQQRLRVAEMLERFQLGKLEQRFPHEVSGGEQQRIALARVLVRRPRLLLLDEPLSALDAPTRDRIRPELRRLLSSFGIPIVLVTHDRIEAMSLADHLVVMDRGTICQQGPVPDVFTRPIDLAVAAIVGMETVQEGKILHIEAGLATVAVGTARLTALDPGTAAREVHVCIRAEEVVLQRGVSDPTSMRNRLEAVVCSLVPEGPMIRVSLDCGFPLVALVTRPACEELHLAQGERVLALLKVPAVHVIERGTSA